MKTFYSILLLFLILPFGESQEDTVWSSSIFKGLEFRSIGPALMAGRIADIAVDPTDENTWYVAVGSGGVWKTVNAGTTWETVFDDQSSYSIGCVTVDPSDVQRIWVGTGENVGGRHVGYGDGIYLSRDAGENWTNMGLEESEHISRILVHPENSDVVWVAAQGPLWSSGGERGLYKTEDGGKTWRRTLGDSIWTGVTDIVIDPRDPNVLYAATWDRHRTVAAYMGGGPGTGVHKSTDGGDTWEELRKGLPKSNMGKIGLAISPQKPDEVYAAIELDLRTGGVYKSFDGGMTWEKRSDAVAGATGPHYYQELYASPHAYDRLYLMDNNMQISEDGGKTFRRMNEKYKHGDNHAIAFKMSDPDYLLVGSDGGLYESYDLAESWRFFENMPITQFYKIAVDDAEPFYNVYGGTQDNSTEGGPSRTDNAQGIQNSDWRVVLNWDGHQPAVEPGNPNIVYGQRQQGTLSRIDMATGEVMDIQPQPMEGEDYERYNWDAPIFISPHSPKRVYFASQRLWRSDDRGDTWSLVSGDLTRNENRLELPIMGRQQSFDNAWDLYAMSNYNTITSIAESPMKEGLLYIGTDDGLIQISDDGGDNWRMIKTEELPGAPERAYVNDIKADLFDDSLAYLALSNHKDGDFKPYLYKTTDQGRTWQSMSENIPDRHLVWRFVQDHIDPDLMFIGTEYGIFMTIDGGEKWVQLKGGLPTISFRDITIHRREDDLVCGSFGRSIYILDDITSLRFVTEEQVRTVARLYPVRDAWWYFPRPHLSFGSKKGSQGTDHFVADNPPFGALFTYYLPEDLKTKKEQRKDREEKIADDQNIPFPGWDRLAAEINEEEPEVTLVVRNADGQVVRRIDGKTKKGFHRVNWDLRYPSPRSIDTDKPEKQSGRGYMAPPGRYTAQLTRTSDGRTTVLSEEVPFEVNMLHEPTLSGLAIEEVADFWRHYEDIVALQSATGKKLDNVSKRIRALRTAYQSSTIYNEDVSRQIYEIINAIVQVYMDLYVNPAKRKPGQKTKPTVGQRISAVARGIGRSRYGPTPTHRKVLSIAEAEL
ncbi:MAG: glycosyl hydrolase, partial [Saprospiraceae bacterium]|nr:glycosyl hydrolase [Saprospiraceae bacterium]